MQQHTGTVEALPRKHQAGARRKLALVGKMLQRVIDQPEQTANQIARIISEPREQGISVDQLHVSVGDPTPMVVVERLLDIAEIATLDSLNARVMLSKKRQSTADFMARTLHMNTNLEKLWPLFRGTLPALIEQMTETESRFLDAERALERETQRADVLKAELAQARHDAEAARAEAATLRVEMEQVKALAPRHGASPAMIRANEKRREKADAFALMIGEAMAGIVADAGHLPAARMAERLNDITPMRRGGRWSAGAVYRTRRRLRDIRVRQDLEAMLDRVLEGMPPTTPRVFIAALSAADSILAEVAGDGFDHTQRHRGEPVGLEPRVQSLN